MYARLSEQPGFRAFAARDNAPSVASVIRLFGSRQVPSISTASNFIISVYSFFYYFFTLCYLISHCISLYSLLHSSLGYRIPIRSVIPKDSIPQTGEYFMYQHPFPYEIIYSNRKTLAIQITSDSGCVYAPRGRCPAPRSNLSHGKRILGIEASAQHDADWHLRFRSGICAAFRFRTPPLHPHGARDLHKTSVLLCRPDERLLRSYLHPRAENTLGKLQQRRQLKF